MQAVTERAQSYIDEAMSAKAAARHEYDEASKRDGDAKVHIDAISETKRVIGQQASYEAQQCEKARADLREQNYRFAKMKQRCEEEEARMEK